MLSKESVQHLPVEITRGSNTAQCRKVFSAACSRGHLYIGVGGSGSTAFYRAEPAGSLIPSPPIFSKISLFSESFVSTFTTCTPADSTSTPTLAGVACICGLYPAQKPANSRCLYAKVCLRSVCRVYDGHSPFFAHARTQQHAHIIIFSFLAEFLRFFSFHPPLLLRRFARVLQRPKLSKTNSVVRCLSVRGDHLKQCSIPSSIFARR